MQEILRNGVAGSEDRSVHISVDNTKLPSIKTVQTHPPTNSVPPSTCLNQQGVNSNSSAGTFKTLRPPPAPHTHLALAAWATDQVYPTAPLPDKLSAT